MEFLTLPKNSHFQQITIPQLGFGTAGIGSDAKTQRVIEMALDAGFRRFDTASMYGNEAAIGKAIRASDVPREEIFVTTKLWDGGDFSYKNTLRECRRSMERLDIDYIDLYMHHWPASNRLESWPAMEELVEEGITHYLGVSNYEPRHLNQLKEQATIMPVLNQVEFNPFLYQEELMQYCQSEGIHLEAYSPFAQGKKLDDSTLKTIGQQYDKSPAQVILRWGIQKGISVIPKASSQDHIEANMAIFDFQLSPEDMMAIDELDENLRLEWDPTTVD